MLKHNFTIITLLILTLLIGMSACDLQKEVDLNLPEYTPELLVECYLEPGKPYRLSLSETTGYFANPIPPFIANAQVIITHDGVDDTLRYVDFNAIPDSLVSLEDLQTLLLAIFPPEEAAVVVQSLLEGDPTEGDFGIIIELLGLDAQKLYNYVSVRTVPFNYDSDFTLKITDQQGRELTGTTVILPPVEHDTLEYQFDEEDSLAFVLTKFQDDPDRANFYRRVLQWDNTFNVPDQVFALDDRFSNGELLIFGTPYQYDFGDTVISTVYHISKDYFDYLETADDAIQANGNPFGTPSLVLSNVSGGIGIFTGLSYDRDTVVIGY